MNWHAVLLCWAAVAAFFAFCYVGTWLVATVGKRFGGQWYQVAAVCYVLIPLSLAFGFLVQIVDDADNQRLHPICQERSQ